MEQESSQWRSVTLLLLLIGSALVLAARVGYLVLADQQRFPINTVKISASYEHISRQELERLLSDSFLNHSFFTLPMKQLRDHLNQLPWTKTTQVERIWPDTLKINLVENTPVAIWNDELLMIDGKVIDRSKETDDLNLPHLRGPQNQQEEVLQVYEKLSKILSEHNFYVTTLEKRDNQAWELHLKNGLMLQLGKKDLDLKIIRFCKAYPAVFQDKLDRAVSVDLRYPRGMAVKWNDQAGR